MSLRSLSPYQKRCYSRLTREQIREIHKLAKTGASLRQISMKLGVAKTTVYYHAKRYCKKMTGFNIRTLTEKEQGYLVGMFVGDGYINRWFDKNENRQRFVVKFVLGKQRDQDIADYLQFIFNKAGKRTTRLSEKTKLIIKVSSKSFVEYLAKYVRNLGQVRGQSRRKMLVDIENWSYHFKLGFISGMIDSDGYIFFNKRSMKPYLVEIKTANPTLKRQLLHILATLKMDTTEFVAKSYEGSYSVKPCYRIHILKRGIQQHRRHFISVKLNRYYSGSGGVGEI